ncbi:glutamine ABC transporter periplasmic protein [Duganella sp. HH105]|nr:glutamine ABC transporter periplasmic protein [Duganella sp. HH105]
MRSKHLAVRMVRTMLALSCAWCASASADVVIMAFGEKIPPFCFPESDSGIELEVMRAALAYRGHTLKPRYYSFARIPVEFKAGEVDAAMTDLGEDMTAWGGYYGDPAVFYDNVFISLKERNLVIKKPEDLRGLKIISFVGAAKRYPEWLDEVKRQGHYFEQNNQALQVLTLNIGRYDVVLSDRNIFKYFTLQLKLNKAFHPKPIVEQSFVKFNPMDYRPVFRDPKIRDDFNAGLKQLKDNGKFNAIYQKYLGDKDKN